MYADNTLSVICSFPLNIVSCYSLSDRDSVSDGARSASEISSELIDIIKVRTKPSDRDL